ncbi:MAG: hypothetical protein IAE87_18600 [Rhodobacteraceae bacterium]|jgi:hypothetical protein|nr:hypothetical protein [Paracoccaceae bacterium]
MIRSRPAFGLLVCAGLAACGPAVPDSGAGVGFQDYDSYLRERSAPAPAAAPAAAPSAGFDASAASAALDRAAGAPAAPAPVATGDTRARGNAPAGIKEETGEMVHATDGGHAGISDENDFQAVASRETIASDKDRIERNKAAYVVDQPAPVPERAGSTGPNIVEYALSTSNMPGTPVYKRGGLIKKDPLVVCAKYASADLAQQAFLAAGGPQKDRLGVDPDGDGFACDWDPRPFRAAVN